MSRITRRTNLITAILFVLLCIIVVLFVYYLGHMAKNTTPPSVATPGAQANTSQYPGATAPESAAAQCHMRGVLPDPQCTPGATNSAVTAANIDSTICKSGYSKTIRPPVSYTDSLKKEQMQEYGFSDSLRKHEEDHLISLELGGSPTDPKNLWPEPHASPNAKDKVEDELHAAVCDGRISLQDAQHRIASDWTTALRGL